MKNIFIFALLICAILCSAFQVDTFGPVAEDFSCANLDQMPASFGILINNQKKLCLWENGVWNSYSYFDSGLTIRGTYMLNADTMLVAMGDLTFSDGIYNFDVNTHNWQLNEWFIMPNFVKFNPNNQVYYVGERDGLYRSADGHNWTRITSLGSNVCNSIAWYESNIITNIGQMVYYSNDNGLNWQQSSISNLRGFRFSDNGALYAIMDVTSDSDGLWLSNDFGANWTNIHYTSALSCIGPVYNGNVTFGWRESNADGSFVGMLNSAGEITYFNHPLLNAPVKQMDIFPYINTPSFYVLNSGGCFFVTGFMVGNEDPVSPEIPPAKISAFPNPAISYADIYLTKTGSEPCALNIYNLKGQKVRDLKVAKTLKEQTLSWDLKDNHGFPISAGMYLLVLQDTKGNYLAKTKLAVVK